MAIDRMTKNPNQVFLGRTGWAETGGREGVQGKEREGPGSQSNSSLK